MLANYCSSTNLFTLLTKILIIMLPFYVIMKVYSDKMLDLGFLGFFIKEFMIVLLFMSLIYEYFINNKDMKLKFDFIDYFMFAFILYWMWISLFNGLWFNSMFFWWSYDFLWFVVFMMYKHWKVFLKEKSSNLLKMFMMSASMSLFLWMMVKFVLWEEMLSLFWFTMEVAQFWFGWWIPMYQWVEASWISSFQWMLDSPLAMWYFLMLFTWLFTYLNKKNMDFWVLLWIIILFSFIFLTYSSAAMLWMMMAIFILFLFSLKSIFKKYKKVLVYVLMLLFIWMSSLGYIFQDKMVNVFLSPWSTEGHITSMVTWMNSFMEKPLGSGLATSGPAYSNVMVWKKTLETDSFYIPESWFVQILVEWWFVYFSLFLAMLMNILLNLYKQKNKYMFVMFMWMLIMNLFLHVFEYTYITILLFLFLGLFYKQDSKML